MLRSLGIPARMAVGYSQGERLVGIEEVITPGPGDILPEDTTPLKDTVDFVVRQRNAHAWPEVYFPGIGWVEFEPTASEDPLLRPLGGNELDEEQDLSDRQDLPDPFDRPDPRDELMEGLEDPSQWAVPGQMPLGRRIALYGFLFLALGLLGVLIWQIRRGFELAPILQMLSVRIPVQLEQGLLRIGIRPPAFLSNWALYATLPSLSRSYLEVNRALSRLGRPPTVGLTPAERVGALSIELPPAADPAQRLLTEYHTATYSLDPADPLVARQAGKEIRRLSLFARFQRLLARIQEPPRRRMFE